MGYLLPSFYEFDLNISVQLSVQLLVIGLYNFSIYIGYWNSAK